MSVGSIGQQIINGTYGLDNRPPTAYEELKAWAQRHNVGYVEWESEWTGNPCIAFNQSEESFIFAKDGSFIGIE